MIFKGDIMRKPIIGIVSRFSIEDKNIFFKIKDEYINVIIKKDGIPFLIIPSCTLSNDENIFEKMTDKQILYLKEIVNMCDGILMPGGSVHYEYDEIIYEEAINLNKPVLGICLGMQIIGKMDIEKKVAMDVTVKNNSFINHNQKNKDYVHEINIINKTLLYEIIGCNKIMINSRHDFHIDKVKNLSISAFSNDGIIEAVEDRNKNFVLGIQWHPESIIDNDINSNKIFDRFILETKKLINWLVFYQSI